MLPTFSGWLIFLFFSIQIVSAQDASIFQPIQPSRSVEAVQMEGHLNVNGRLDETEWKVSRTTSDFFQVEPNQGKPVRFDTRVKVLYNQKYLYFGIFCPDSLGKKGIRVRDMRRDFSYGDYDQFSVVFDPFRDQRNAVVFATHPYGAQRDLLGFDDQFFDTDWDALWRVRTHRTDSGWFAEMALPWKTLRYPRDSTQWGVQFSRVARRINQTSAWSPHPRSFTASRMAYAGIMKGIQPPQPSVNVRVQPYFLGTYDHERRNGMTTNEQFKPKLGGEVKWAIKPQTVLDLTVNTDFAQADADRQVQNLTRFSVFFPERRQFFLENATLFSPGLSGTVQPFFSRRIGLSPTGQPLPIDAGARLASRTTKQSFGGLLVHQRSAGGFLGATAAVARYTRNLGKQNRVGALVTVKAEDRVDTLAPVTNLVGAVDGFFRLSQPLSFDFMLSGSATRGARSNGLMGYAQFKYDSPQASAYLGQSWITANYNPALGFIYDANLVNTYFGGYPNYRPKWKPKFLRSFEPDLNADFYHRVTDGALMQYQISTSPVFFNFQSGSLFYLSLIPTYQRLDYPFQPLGLAELTVREGRYSYLRYKAYYGSDQSKKLTYSATYETGNYYSGHLQSWSGTLRISPVPHVALSLNYQQNRFRRLGTLEETTKVTQLVTPEIRLALNPRVQLIGFYQKNTAIERDVWNVRLSWEFQPLSYLYLVYNRNAVPVSNGVNGLGQQRNEQVIGKLTYLKQF